MQENASRRRLWGRAITSLTPWALAALLLPASARAGNGDVLRVAEALSSVGREFVDLAVDPSDGSFWVLGASGSSQENHRIYHLSRDLSAVLGTLENPHPMGAISTSDLTLNRGIAFHAPSGRLFVLAWAGPRGEQSYRVRVIDRSGTETPELAFVIARGDTSASLYGLTFDSVHGQFWTLDAQNDKALRVALDGTAAHVFTLPGKTTPDVLIRGTGITFDNEDLVLYITYGDLLSPGPTKIIQLLPEGVDAGGSLVGERTGVEVPLAEVPSADIRGIAAYRVGLELRRFAIITGPSSLYEIEQVVPSIIPPTELACTLTATNQVMLSWVNHGPGPGAGYSGSIQVLRNGVPFATVPGDSSTFTDETPVDGASSYALRPSDGDALGELSCECRVYVGPGGVIDWTVVPGHGVFDVTELPDTGELLVTDDLGGRIHRLAADLGPSGDGSYPSPWPNPGGIAYIPSIFLGFPPQPFADFVAIANTSDNRLRLVSRTDPASGVTISLQFPAEVSRPRIGGLDYIPSDVSSGQLFVTLEKSTDRVYVFRNNGAFVRQCDAPEIFFDAALGCGVTYDAIQNTFLLAFQDGIVRELFTEGPPDQNICPVADPDFEISLESLGQAFREPEFIGGIRISANTLLVCGRGNGTVFRVLLFPFSPDFTRGDVDRNAVVDLTDAVRLAEYLFRRGPPPSCLDAGDANDDGILDVSDPVYLLFFLFAAGSSPPPPFPEPGNDPTFRDTIGCLE